MTQHPKDERNLRSTSPCLTRCSAPLTAPTRLEQSCTREWVAVAGLETFLFLLTKHPMVDCPAAKSPIRSNSEGWYLIFS